MRPVCANCKQRPRAIAYHTKQRTQYRRLCEYCIKRGRRERPPVSRWKLSGYKKKTTCDRCGFRSRYAAQLMVYHVDGNLNNSEQRNLRTVCLNCVEEIKRSAVPWRAGDLEPDV